MSILGVHSMKGHIVPAPWRRDWPQCPLSPQPPTMSLTIFPPRSLGPIWFPWLSGFFPKLPDRCSSSCGPQAPPRMEAMFTGLLSDNEGKA